MKILTAAAAMRIAKIVISNATIITNDLKITKNYTPTPSSRTHMKKGRKKRQMKSDAVCLF